MISRIIKLIKTFLKKKNFFSLKNLFESKTKTLFIGLTHKSLRKEDNNNCDVSSVDFFKVGEKVNITYLDGIGDLYTTVRTVHGPVIKIRKGKDGLIYLTIHDIESDTLYEICMKDGLIYYCHKV